MERIINIMGESPDRENIMKIWNDYTIDSVIIVLEKAMQAIKPKAINSCWRKLCPDVHDFTGFRTQPIKEIMKKIVNIAEKKKSVG